MPGSSSIKFDGTGDYLSVADSSDWALGSTFSIEAWVRFASTSSDLTLLNHWKGNGALASWSLQLDGGNTAKFFYSTDGVNSAGNSSWSWTPSLNTWYHVMVSRNSADLRFFVDGTQVGSTYDIGASAIADISWPLEIGYYSNIGGYGLNGYLDEVRIKDTAVTSSFTPNSTTAFTSDSNTKLLIHSNWAGGLGADSSGQGNDFASTNLTANDKMLDAPGVNRCTMNPLAKASDSYNTLKEGNLHLETTGQGSVLSTMAVSSGKWYWECLVSIEPTWWPVVGFCKTTAPVGVGNQNFTGEQTGSWGYLTETGAWYVDGSTSSTYTAVSAGDILQFALDMDAGKAWVGINNTWVNSGNPSTGANAIVTSGLTGDITPAFSDSDGAGHDLVANFGADSSFAGAKTSAGAGEDGDDFAYAPPSGFKALKASNLSPTIADPTDHFNTVLYTGDGSTSNTITTGLQPDLVWTKERLSSTGNHNIYDSVRGASKAIYPNLTTNEQTSTGTQDLHSFNSTGFTIGTNYNALINTDGAANVSWNWKAGGTASTNTDGAVDTQVSANTTAGFSIVTYTSDGSSTAGHGLSQSPELIIIKNRTTNFNWPVGGPPINPDAYWQYHLFLSSNAARVDETAYFGYQTAATATTFPLGNSVGSNDSGDDYVAYCWHSVPGFSKVGSYTGNGSKVFIYTGFKPAYLLVKEYANTSSWYIQDNKRNSYNEVKAALYANSNSAEDSAGVFSDFVSNGFVAINDGSSGASNISGRSYIYLAFAESPFAYSTAK
jgi:hypothetical protein